MGVPLLFIFDFAFFYNKSGYNSKKSCIFANLTRKRDVAQPGSALRSGRRGRKFESCHPDFVKRFHSSVDRATAF